MSEIDTSAPANGWLPCPFCGGPAAEHQSSFRGGGTFICCADSQCMGYHFEQDEQGGWSYDGTAETWNRRASYTKAEVAALVAAGPEGMIRALDDQWNKDRAASWSSPDYGQGRADGTETAINLVRAASATEALAAIRAEAEARGMERAAGIVNGAADSISRSHTAYSVRAMLIDLAAAIRAAAAKGEGT